MKWKLGYGTIGLAALLLTAGLVWYNIRNAPPEVPTRIAFASAPVLNPYPELEGLVVHVNTATEAELQQLPGIGPERAADIRAYIRDYGRITSEEQLLEIRGIGEKTLEQIAPFLSFD